MTVDEYLSASGYGGESAQGSDGGIPILDWLPPLTDLTPEWILTHFLLPAFGFFLINLITTPLQDKLFFGEEYDIDWSGRSGRFYKLFFSGEDPLKVPDPKSDMKIGGDLEELRERRSAETGLLADMTRDSREKALAEAEKAGGALEPEPAIAGKAAEGAPAGAPGGKSAA